MFNYTLWKLSAILMSLIWAGSRLRTVSHNIMTTWFIYCKSQNSSATRGWFQFWKFWVLVSNGLHLYPLSNFIWSPVHRRDNRGGELHTHSYLQDFLESLSCTHPVHMVPICDGHNVMADHCHSRFTHTKLYDQSLNHGSIHLNEVRKEKTMCLI